MSQVRTILEETVQGAAKVLSEAAATTKSSVDAAKQASHRNSATAPTHVPEPTRCCLSRFLSTVHSDNPMGRTHRKREAFRNESLMQSIHSAGGYRLSIPFPTPGLARSLTILTPRIF